ncbi:hypothetical protein [Fuerstiella marisgermanici]|uniref:HEAT repeat domain-containing protein n=1 Tax=Fuerstiella marisgermanici TaxID=1891926 RepID=A0A1P8WPW5_9PLAN|nr:hypothetical protein [Fuerstiella marisgermanici]APZ96097.1 hypothetical protein Fuma_05765 [Fuerstiella marisgermanici]
MKCTCTAILLTLVTATTRADNIEALQSVGPAAAGAAAAREASAELINEGSKNLLPLLKAFKGSSVLATNWLRSTFEAIADAEIKAGRSLPKDELVAFVKSTQESPAARRLAYEWLLKRSPQLEDTLIPEMLLDPSPEFRRDAVTRLINKAKSLQGEAATATYRKAMTGAVHEDQVKTIAKALRSAGEEVDIQKHFGFLAAWKIIGPFDNKDMQGFPVEYPPEKSVDLDAEYDGQLGKVKWGEVETDNDFGMVDIARQIENYKGSVMYATTTFESDKEQSAEIRLGTPNAWKLWVNGELVFGREEYHRGTSMDQYRVPVKLQSGPNTILLKICQNEQDQDWAQRYQFQLRVCDNTGSAVN